jgi:hypothetical protein
VAVVPLAHDVGGVVTLAAVNFGAVAALHDSDAKPDAPPEFWNELDSHTYAGAPWNTPAPPRTTFRRSPVTL